MTDIITKIVRKKIALYAQIKEIKRESYRQIVEIVQEIAAIDKAVETLNKVVCALSKIPEKLYSCF